MSCESVVVSESLNFSGYLLYFTGLSFSFENVFLNLSHTNLDLFKVSRTFTLLCYKETKNFPSDEKFAMIQQIRRAALSVHLNIAECASRKSLAERKRFYEIARGSLVEVDTAFDIAVELNYTTKEQLQELGSHFIRCFQML